MKLAAHNQARQDSPTKIRYSLEKRMEVIIEYYDRIHSEALRLQFKKQLKNKLNQSHTLAKGTK